MRLSRMLRRADMPAAAPIAFRSWLLWGLVATAIAIGVLLYFRYERSLTPLVN